VGKLTPKQKEIIMKKYKVKVDINDTQFWEVEAESEQEAMDNYVEGSHYHTNSHGEDVEVVEEIKENEMELS
jgi:hypothetical protein